MYYGITTVHDFQNFGILLLDRLNFAKEKSFLYVKKRKKIVYVHEVTPNDTPPVFNATRAQKKKISSETSLRRAARLPLFHTPMG